MNVNTKKKQIAHALRRKVGFIFSLLPLYAPGDIISPVPIVLLSTVVNVQKSTDTVTDRRMLEFLSINLFYAPAWQTEAQLGEKERFYFFLTSCRKILEDWLLRL